MEVRLPRGQVDEAALFQVAEAGWTVIRTSAKSGEGVEDAFRVLTKAMLAV